MGRKGKLKGSNIWIDDDLTWEERRRRRWKLRKIAWEEKKTERRV